MLRSLRSFRCGPCSLEAAPIGMTIGVGGAALLAWPIHHFSLVGTLGWAMIPFFAVSDGAFPLSFTNPFVLDFAGVDYISSAGLRVLMLAAKQVKVTGTKLVNGAELTERLTDAPAGVLYKALVETKKAASVSGFSMPLHDPGYTWMTASVRPSSVASWPTPSSRPSPSGCR